MSSVITPNFFKMRLGHEMPRWKQIVWKLFGKKAIGTEGGYICEGYWLRGICLITKCEPKNQEPRTEHE